MTMPAPEMTGAFGEVTRKKLKALSALPAAPTIAMPNFKNAAMESTDAFAKNAGYDMQQSVGKMLGNLNSIGALRSGAVSEGVQDASRTFGERVGNAAAQNALQAEGMGLDFQFRDRDFTEGHRRWEQERRDAMMAAKQKRKSGLLGAVGSALGFVAGSALGPIGGAIGTKVGNAITGKIGG